MVGDYLASLARARAADPASDPATDPLLKEKADKISQDLQALGNPSKTHTSQLPLFPLIYRLEIQFEGEPTVPPILWDSGLPRHPSQYRVLKHPLRRVPCLGWNYQFPPSTKGRT